MSGAEVDETGLPLILKEFSSQAQSGSSNAFFLRPKSSWRRNSPSLFVHELSHYYSDGEKHGHTSASTSSHLLPAPGRGATKSLPLVLQNTVKPEAATKEPSRLVTDTVEPTTELAVKTPEFVQGPSIDPLNLTLPPAPPKDGNRDPPESIDLCCSMNTPSIFLPEF